MPAYRTGPSGFPELVTEDPWAVPEPAAEPDAEPEPKAQPRAAARKPGKPKTKGS
jgi:hypothetical protein